ncbi:MAG: AAA family ATPase, partial [Anaerolineales bacterium]|nr:AAA family ATPase [Anaerolineales bacterium]
MPSLEIALFGGVQVLVDGQPVALPYDKVRALLAYLLLEARDFPQRRETLAGLLWPEQTEKEARHSLSQALLKLRQAIDPQSALIMADRQSISLPTSAPLSTDTVEFTSQLQQAQRHQHSELPACECCMAQLRAAATLYKGPFLAGLSLADAPQFESWLTQQREYYQQQLLDTLAALIAAYTQHGEWREAIQFTQQQLALEPWLEESHRQLMMLYARTGQRSLALKQYEQCRASLQEELGTDVAPETQTLANQIRLRPNFSLQNLPVNLTPFIGREQESTLVKSWLTESTSRLITLTGLGGMGKTRLALATARHFLQPQTAQPTAPFADGIYLIDLIPLTTPTQIETAVAEALHLHLSAGGSARQQIIDYLRDKQLLLIFDNFEHLLSGAPLLAELLQAAPNLSILTTSRTRLRLRGEKVLALSGLAHHHEGTARAGPSAATQLFLSTARQVAPELEISPDDEQAIKVICQLVEGIPLAVELAARWVDTLPISVIASELKRDINQLATDLQDLPARQRSMQAVFHASWQRLPESARRLLARASVFQGGFTLEAAITVLGATHQNLAQLVNHSLLQFDQAEKRYHCHELLRQYAAAQLASDPELERQTRQKQLTYFCEFAAQGEQHLRGGDTILWKRVLGAEKGNWQVAFEWGIVNELEMTARMAIHLSLFWFDSGQMQLGERLYERLLRRQDELTEWLKGWVLTWYTAMIWVQGRLEECRRLALEANRLFAILDDGPGLVMSYHHQYVAAFHSGDLETAAHHNKQALTIARNDPLVPPWFLSVCLQTRSGLLAEVGQDEAADHAARECLQLCQANRDVVLEAYALATLARLAIKRGAFAEARSVSQRALAIAQDMDDPRMESIQYVILGNIALAERDFPAAVDTLETAVAIGEMTNNTDILDEAIMLLGRDAYTGIGEYERALEALQRWAQICLQLENEANMAACLDKIARVQWQLKPGNLATVRWLAAAAAWRESHSSMVDATDQNRLLAKIREQITATEFWDSWELGR